MHPPAPRRSILAVTALAGLALAVPGGAAAAPHAHAAKKPKPRVTAKVAKRTLTVNGTKKADAIALTRKGSRLKIDAGTTHVAIRHKAFDRIVVRGGRGDDAITGSSLRETLIGGAGDDSLRGGDRDVLKGGAGNDAARFQGSKASEAIAVKPAGTHVRIQRGALAQDLSAIERIDVRGGAGDDAITAADGLAAAITLQGGQGNDSITGAGAAETLTGGDGNDTIEPRGGDDRADLGTGDDTAVERAGDGRDAVAGGPGDDRVALHGTDQDERIDAAPDGPRLRLTRDGDAIDATDVERADVDTLGGADALTVTGTAAADALRIADWTVSSPRATIAFASVAGDRLTVRGEGGDDALDAGAGTAPVGLEGGSGNDRLTGGAASDALAGGDGDDALEGRGGRDSLHGDSGDDTFTATPADGGDAPDGGAGIDTTILEGGAQAESYLVSARDGRPHIERTAPAPFAQDADQIERVDLRGGGGDDTLAAGDLTALGTKLVLQGGAGADTITGSPAADTITGGDGNDRITPARGNDTALLGAGNDVLVWNPGEGSDTTDGQAGTDTMDFRGANAAEQFTLSANGGRLKLFRDVGNITMDADDLEHVAIAALGGADVVTVGSLAGTDVTDVAPDFAGTPGGTTDDGQADALIAQGGVAAEAITIARKATPDPIITGLGATITSAHFGPQDGVRADGNGGDDTITVDSTQGSLPTLTLNGGDGHDITEVNGGNAGETFTVSVNGTRTRFDRVSPLPFALDTDTEALVLNANGGDDTISATNGLATILALAVDGGAGDDTIGGGDGADLLLGGDGADTITPARGNDTAILGAGDDTAIWNPGDGNDTLEGQAGNDTMDFRGANVAEQFSLTANGDRLKLFRNVANITMDAHGIEDVAIEALAGVDTITVGSLAGTDAKHVDLDLAGALGGSTGDGQADHVTVTGTDGADALTVSGSSGDVLTSGLSASVALANAEAADTLTLDTLAGNDTVNSAGLAAGTVTLDVK